MKIFKTAIFAANKIIVISKFVKNTQTEVKRKIFLMTKFALCPCRHNIYCLIRQILAGTNCTCSNCIYSL